MSYTYSRHMIGKTSLSIFDSTSKPSRVDLEPQVTGVTILRQVNNESGEMTNVPVNASPLTVDDVGVIICSTDGRVQLFSDNYSKLYWTKRLDHPVYSSPVAIPLSNDILIASTAGMVIRLSLRGEVLWIKHLENGVYGTIACTLTGDLAYIPTFNHKIQCIDLASGDKQWEVETSGKLFRYGVAHHRAPYASPAVFDDGRVVVVDHDNVMCIDRMGNILWRRLVNGCMRSSPVIVGNDVACISTQGKVYKWERNGKQHELINLRGRVDSSPAVWRDSIIVGVRGMGPQAIRISDGRWLWQANTPGVFEYTSFVLGSGDELMYTNDRGTITALRPRTGSFLWETSQVIGTPERATEIHTSPSPSASGTISVASYDGACYQFRYPQ